MHLIVQADDDMGSALVVSRDRSRKRSAGRLIRIVEQQGRVGLLSQEKAFWLRCLDGYDGFSSATAIDVRE